MEPQSNGQTFVPQSELEWKVQEGMVYCYVQTHILTFQFPAIFKKDQTNYRKIRRRASTL